MFFEKIGESNFVSRRRDLTTLPAQVLKQEEEVRFTVGQVQLQLVSIFPECPLDQVPLLISSSEPWYWRRF